MATTVDGDAGGIRSQGPRRGSGAGAWACLLGGMDRSAPLRAYSREPEVRVVAWVYQMTLSHHPPRGRYGLPSIAHCFAGHAEDFNGDQ